MAFSSQVFGVGTASQASGTAQVAVFQPLLGAGGNLARWSRFMTRTVS
jgi:hypothetical protein